MKATITKVALVNTANGKRIALNLSSGDTQWYPVTYIEKLLEANFMEGSRPTVLIGTEVEFTKLSYKIGDKVVDQNGVEVKPAIKHEKAGTKLIKFVFGDIAGHTTEFDKAQMTAKAVGAALAGNKYASLAAVKPVVAQVEEEDEDEDEEPVKPVKGAKKAAKQDVE